MPSSPLLGSLFAGARARLASHFYKPQNKSLALFCRLANKELNSLSLPSSFSCFGRKTLNPGDKIAYLAAIGRPLKWQRQHSRRKISRLWLRRRRQEEKMRIFFQSKPQTGNNESLLNDAPSMGAARARRFHVCILLTPIEFAWGFLFTSECSPRERAHRKRPKLFIRRHF